jgi:hypothetical protein
MIVRHNRQGLAFDVLGIVLQLAAEFLIDRQRWGLVLPQGLYMVGTVLLGIGLAYDAKAKGRSPAWCLMALLSIVGVLVLAVLEDRSGSTPETGEKHEQT